MNHSVATKVSETIWHLLGRDEHWTGLRLDWIRTITNFVDFGFDPDCNMLQKFRIRTGFGLS